MVAIGIHEGVDVQSNGGQNHIFSHRWVTIFSYQWSFGRAPLARRPPLLPKMWTKTEVLSKFRYENKYCAKKYKGFDFSTEYSFSSRILLYKIIKNDKTNQPNQRLKCSVIHFKELLRRPFITIFF